MTNGNRCVDCMWNLKRGRALSSQSELSFKYEGYFRDSGTSHGVLGAEPVIWSGQRLAEKGASGSLLGELRAWKNAREQSGRAAIAHRQCGSVENATDNTGGRVHFTAQHHRNFSGEDIADNSTAAARYHAHNDRD